jgi:GT2 family glycosyltransferase
LEATLLSLNPATIFAIVVPVYNTPTPLLEALVNSVVRQWYPHWQLLLVDDASPSPETQAALNGISHPKIQVIRLPNNRGISGATNAGIQAAFPKQKILDDHLEGDRPHKEVAEFIVFLDHDDELTVDCLYELALCIHNHQPDFIYSDEDKLTESGQFADPHFKPDWSPDTMMTTMFTCHVSCVRRSIVDRIGGLRSEFDGCQDWDFVLRLSEHTNRIFHIPKVLYHWRAISGSIATQIDAKPQVVERTKAIRQEALARRNLEGVLEPVVQAPGYFRVAYEIQGNPLISIVIPTRDNHKILDHCINSILQRTEYDNYQIIVLDNGSVDADTLSALENLKQNDRIAVIRHDAPFNFSELNNIGAQASEGQLLLFLNDDTEVIQSDWLSRLAGFAQLSHVGAVSAKLLYPGNVKIQHAGVINLEAGPGHALLGADRDAPGYFMRNLLEFDWLAVTGACLMIQKDKFIAVGGFSEELPIAYNDIDLCMRLVRQGLYNVVVPAVCLIHHESASRGVDHLDPEKQRRLILDRRKLYERNPQFYQTDPFHNPNLHPNGIHFEVPTYF